MSANAKAGLLASLLGLPVLFGAFLLVKVFIGCELIVWPVIGAIGLLSGLLAAIMGRRSGECCSVRDCLPACIVPALGVWLVMIASGVLVYVLFPELAKGELETLEERFGSDHAFLEVRDLVLTPRFIIFSGFLQNTCCCGLVHVLLVLLGTLAGALLGLSLGRGPDVLASLSAADVVAEPSAPVSVLAPEEQGDNGPPDDPESLPPVGPPPEPPNYPTWLKDE